MLVVVLAVIVASMVITRIQNRHWIREQKRLGTYPVFTMHDLRGLIFLFSVLAIGSLIIAVSIAAFTVAYSIAPGAVAIAVVMYYLGRFLQLRCY